MLPLGYSAPGFGEEATKKDGNGKGKGVEGEKNGK